MEITKEIKEAVTSLSKFNLDFLEFVEKNPGTCKRSNFKLLELNHDLFTLQPWPTFINKATRSRFREAGLELCALIKSIPRRIFNYDFEKMSRFYNIPVNSLKRQFEGVNRKHLDNQLGRGDFILSPSGLKCLEYNFSASLGGWQVPIWESLYLNTPLIARFFKEYGVKTIRENLILTFLEHLVRSAPEEIFSGEQEMNIVMVGPQFGEGKSPIKSYLSMLYKQVLRQKAPSLRGNIHACDYCHLEIVDGCIFHKAERIHTLVEMYRGYVPPEIMTVFKSGNVHLMNGPVSVLLANKLNLALLSEGCETDIFTGEEKEIIRRYVPWTRKIESGLVDFIRSNRESLVIKPGSGYGGTGVCVGRKVAKEQWEYAVKTAVTKGNWVVQERVDTVGGLYQAGDEGYDVHDMSWGFFVFGPWYAGVWVRVLPRKNNRGVINCHQGATVSVVFNVDE